MHYRVAALLCLLAGNAFGQGYIQVYPAGQTSVYSGSPSMQEYSAGGGAAWGSITGTLANQTDIQNALNAKGTSNFSGAYTDLTGKPALFDGVYSSLTGKPALGTAAATASTDYATAAQGALAGTALQDAAAFATAAQGALAASALQPAGNGSALTGLTKSQVGLGSAENTALSTWAGTANITTVGTLSAGSVPWTLLSSVPAAVTALSGTNTGDQTSVSGNAGTATALQTPRTINGVSFNGTANITVTAAGSTLSDNVPVTKLNSGTGASASTYWRGDGTWAAAGGGSDPWTYLVVNGGSDFGTTSTTAADVTGLGFAPSANTKYEIECVLALRTATTTVNPRVGLAWSTGLTDGVAVIQVSQAATGTPLFASGNPNAALLTAVGGLPNTTQSWPARVTVSFTAGATPSGNTRVQLASETNGTSVTAKTVGSFCRYRSHA